MYMPPDLSAYFAPLREPLTTFAADHGMILQKYYHDAPTWSLCFGHPNGGQTKIDVTAVSDSEVQIQAIWWCDDYDTFTRSVAWGAKQNASLQEDRVMSTVKQTFQEALLWQDEARTDIVHGYASSWSN